MTTVAKRTQQSCGVGYSKSGRCSPVLHRLEGASFAWLTESMIHASGGPAFSDHVSREKFNVAEAEAVESVEGNMLCTAMQGVTALPWSETPLRMKGRRRNLGDLTSPIRASAVLGHDGKSMR